MIDRNPSHGWLWFAIGVAFILILLVTWGAVGDIHRLDQRIKALEEQR